MRTGRDSSKTNSERRRPRAESSKARKSSSGSPRTTVTAHPTSRDPRVEFSDEEWHDMVATAAYYRAESRGFEGGSPEEDWHEAEARLREQLALAENEADQSAESGLDLKAHGNGNRTSK